MKTKLLLIFVCYLLSVTYCFTQGTWTQKTDFGGTARTDAVGFSIGNKGYIGTGLDSIVGVTNDFWEYDPSTDTWTQKANFAGTPRCRATGFSIGSKGYIGTGNAGNGNTYFNDFWQWDQATNIWTQKADFGGATRCLAIGFSIEGKGYIGTGYNGNSYTSDFWEYDTLSNIWTQKMSFPSTGRGPASGFSIGTNIYLGTGNDNGGPTNDFWEYNPANDTWTQKSSLPDSLCGASGFSISNKGYIGLGALPYYPFSNGYWEYNPLTNIWIQIASFGGTGRRNAASFSINGKGYVGTGYHYNNSYFGYLNDFWEYTPDSTEGVNEIDLLKLISVYPNPTRGVFNVQMSGLADVRMKIYNVLGECIYQQFFKSTNQQIDVSAFTQGCYFIQITLSSGEIYRTKFIKQ